MKSGKRRTFEQVLELLPDARWSGSDYRAQCPAHQGHDRNLAFNEDADGNVWVKCWSNDCTSEAIWRALGLWNEPKEGGLTLEVLAAAKGFDVADLKAFGVRDGVIGNSREPCVDIPYPDEEGELLRTQKRGALEGPFRFSWSRGTGTPAYGLWRFADARKQGRWVAVEGASDCWASWLHDIPALGFPGASTWNSRYAALGEGLDALAWQEPGEAGERFVARIAADIPHVRIIIAPADAKDPCALRQLDPAAFRERMETLIAEARPFQERLDKRSQLLLAEATAVAAPLLERENLVADMVHMIRRLGYAGDVRPAGMSYATLTSRLLHKPINMAIIAQSAAGKNAAVETPLPLFPADAYLMLRATTPAFLPYTDEDFRHRIVIASEADSLPEDGHLASARRSLIDNQCLDYQTIEKDENGKIVARQIKKPGPTAIITTSTKALPDQGATRMLTLSISDSAEQTREIIRIQSQEYAGTKEAVDPTQWVALQTMLGLLGPHDVIVPFSHALSDLISVTALRMRRDFPQLNRVIQAVALLRQHQRARDDKGRIIATVEEDYRDARWLLEEVFATVTSDGLTPAIRQTAEAVQELHAESDKATTEAALMTKLGLARTTIQYRVNQAIKGGWVTNQGFKGKSKELYPGELDLPGTNSLPTVEAVCAQWAQETHAVVGQLPEIYPFLTHSAIAQRLPNGSSAVVQQPSVATAELPNARSDGSTHTQITVPDGSNLKWGKY